MNTTTIRKRMPALLIVGFAICGFVALVIDARTNNPTLVDRDPRLTKELKEYQHGFDSTNTFSYSFPTDWELKPYIWENCCEGEKSEPDWTQESKPITLSPKENTDVKVKMSVIPYGLYYDSFEALKATVKEDYFATVQQEGMSSAGRQSLFVVVNYLGPPDAKVESFTDHRYYFDNGSGYLYVEFSEKYHHDWYPERDMDHGAFTQDFETIANSVSFLK